MKIKNMKIKVYDTDNNPWFIISKQPKKDLKGFYTLYVKKELDSLEFQKHVVSFVEYEDLCRGKKILNR